MSGQQSMTSISSPSTNPRTGKQWKRYCWTHGCCNHWGRNCNNKNTGHKDDTTFCNRIGGNDTNCLPTRNWQWRGAGSLSTFLSKWLNLLTISITRNTIYPVASNTSQPSHALLLNTTNPFTAKLDSGAFQHYLKLIHAQFLQHQTPVQNNMRINLPEGNTIAATHQGIFPINKHLPGAAQLVFIPPHLINESLLSEGQFCDYDCDVLFRKWACYIAWNNQIILQGLRNRFDGLWDITLPTTKTTLTT